VTAPFTIYVMQSAHTDIGFTHPQEQIASMYLDYYDRVLELCRQTEDMPEASRFKWTCETSWQARHYLVARPEREEEFLRYARAGQIELTASYLHFTDLIDPDGYRRSLDWALDYGRRHDLPLHCALHCDVNGWPWAVADILAASGIPYFCSQINGATPLGRRGAVHYHQIREDEQQHMLRSDAPIRVPRAFWWEGSAGGRVLHWLGEHYHLGNVLGISSPHPFGADKTRYFTETDRLTVDDLYERARREVPRYLARLRAEGYQDDALLISTAGFYVDNSPPDGRWLQVIARWNSERDDIRLRTATLGEWFDRLAACDMGTWPTYRAAWPDYWAEGLGAATARVAQVRRMQRRRADADAVVDRARSSSTTASLATALEQERLALEHTFDAWCTTGRPGAAINDFQQTAKELTFHRAELYVDEAIGTALRAITPPGDAPRLYIHATVEGSSDDGFRVAHFDAGDQQLDPDTQALAAANGEIYPFQEDRPALKQYLAVLPIQQGGLQDFGLVARGGGGDVSVPPQTGASSVAGTAATTGRGEPPALPVTTGPDGARTQAPACAADAGQVGMETAGWSLRVDPATGGLASLRERATGREWADVAHEYAFGQLVHEVIVHPFGRQAVFDPGRFVALGVASEELRRRFTDGPVFERATPTPVGTPRYAPGQVFDAVTTEARGERIGHARLSWRLYHTLPIAELALDWDKTWNNLPEAAYVAFPFAAPGGDLLLETGGGFFRPGSHEAGGQVPGTCPSYYTVQRAARLAAPDGAALLWFPLDAPLVMPNQLKFDNWETDPWTWNGFLASMPVNHYWFTNFPTSQRGPLRLRYRFVGARDWPDDETAVRTAMPVEALGWR